MEFASPKKPRRPPNGYNLFLRRRGKKAKERDRAWEIYCRKTRNSHVKANKLARIAKTGEIAGLWGGDTEMRERFEREAKELQELYRAQIESWRAADRFVPYRNYLVKSQHEDDDQPLAASPSNATKASMAAAAAARASAAAAVPMIVAPYPTGTTSAPTGNLRRPATEMVFMLL